MTVPEFDCRISANSPTAQMLVYPACKKKGGGGRAGIELNKMRAEFISLASRHTSSSCCSLMGFWSILKAWPLSTGIYRALQFVLQKESCIDMLGFKAYVM